ncbi:MAG: hypothetical protein RSE00_02660 [Clostridia bacterium]
MKIKFEENGAKQITLEIVERIANSYAITLSPYASSTQLEIFKKEYISQCYEELLIQSDISKDYIAYKLYTFISKSSSTANIANALKKANISNLVLEKVSLPAISITTPKNFGKTLNEFSISKQISRDSLFSRITDIATMCISQLSLNTIHLTDDYLNECINFPRLN